MQRRSRSTKSDLLGGWFQGLADRVQRMRLRNQERWFKIHTFQQCSHLVMDWMQIGSGSLPEFLADRRRGGHWLRKTGSKLKRYLGCVAAVSCVTSLWRSRSQGPMIQWLSNYLLIQATSRVPECQSNLMWNRLSFTFINCPPLHEDLQRQSDCAKRMLGSWRWPQAVRRGHADQVDEQGFAWFWPIWGF